MTASRRGFLAGLGASLIAAPAIVRAPSLMQVRGIVMAPEYGSGPMMIARGELARINDAFLASLFKILSQHPTLTATQTLELLAERGMLAA